MERTSEGQLVCAHCGRPISGNRYVRSESGVYLGEECLFRDTYLDGIVAGIEATYLTTIEAFVTAIDAREHGTGTHSLRVSRLGVILAHACGMTGRDLTDIYCGSLLHDVGKIGVPDAVLLKEGPLSDAERHAMQQHPEIGFRIVGHIGYLAKAAEIVRAHHEHFDGGGYPRGLGGEAIPRGARIFSVADALDALTVRRPYREALPFEAALVEIEKEKGRAFDPAVVEAAWRAREELRGFIGSMPPRPAGRSAS